MKATVKLAFFPNPTNSCGKKGFEIGVPRFALSESFKTEFQAAQFVFDFALIH